jgi:hypothetical protein
MNFFFSFSLSLVLFFIYSQISLSHSLAQTNA